MDQSNKPTFTFINLSHPDDLKDQNTIDQIRCSAMTNFGKMRKKRKPKPNKDQVVFEVRPPQQIMGDGATMSRVGLETLDPFMSAPFEMDAYASGLCSNIFGTNNGHSSDIRSAWSSVGFHDDLSFQMVLSNSALYGQMLRSGQLPTDHTAESLQLHNKALQKINEKLNDPEQQSSNSAIGSISGFLTYDYIIGNFDGWNRHMDGLLQMIKLRGGVEALANEELHITLSWADICGSFSQDIPPHLPLPPRWMHALPRPPVELLHPICEIWNREFLQSKGWILLWDLVLNLAFDPAIPPNTWMEPMLYRLLELRPLQHADPTSAPQMRIAIVEEVCRIGTLLALAPVWRTFGIHPVRTLALRRNLLHILTTYFTEWGELRPLLLWVLMHAAREAETDAERSEFGIRLGMVMAKTGIWGWSGLVYSIKDVVPCEDEGDTVWDHLKDTLARMGALRNASFGSLESGMEWGQGMGGLYVPEADLLGEGSSALTVSSSEYGDLGLDRGNSPGPSFE